MSDKISQNKLKNLLDKLINAIKSDDKELFIQIMTENKAEFDMKIDSYFANGNTLNHSIARAVQDNYCSNNNHIKDCHECISEGSEFTIPATPFTASITIPYGEKPFKISQFILKNESVLKAYKNLFEYSYKKIKNNKEKTPYDFAEKCNINLYDNMNNDDNDYDNNDNNNDDNNDNDNDENDNNNDDNGDNGNSDNGDNGDNNNNYNNNNQVFTNFIELYEYYKNNPTSLSQSVTFKVLEKYETEFKVLDFLKITPSDITLFSEPPPKESILRIEEMPVFTPSNFYETMNKNNEINFNNYNFIIIKCQCLEDDKKVTYYANETARHAGYKTTVYKNECNRININCDKTDNFNFYYVDTNGNKRKIKLVLEPLNIVEGGKIKNTHITKKNKTHKSLKSHKSHKSHKSKKIRKSRKSKKIRKSRKSKKHRRSHRR